MRIDDKIPALLDLLHLPGKRRVLQVLGTLGIIAQIEKIQHRFAGIMAGGTEQAFIRDPLMNGFQKDLALFDRKITWIMQVIIYGILLLHG